MSCAALVLARWLQFRIATPDIRYAATRVFERVTNVGPQFISRTRTHTDVRMGRAVPSRARLVFATARLPDPPRRRHSRRGFSGRRTNGSDEPVRFGLLGCAGAFDLHRDRGTGLGTLLPWAMAQALIAALCSWLMRCVQWPRRTLSTPIPCAVRSRETLRIGSVSRSSARSSMSRDGGHELRIGRPLTAIRNSA